MATLKAIRESQQKLDELAAIVRDSVKPSIGWIKCSDQLPPEGEKRDYLCLFEYGQMQVTEWLHDKTLGWCFWYGDPSHWMPLPPLPTE